MDVSYKAYMDYLFSRARVHGTPLSGTFELTSRCNLDCKMCYIHRREHDREALENELSADEWIKLAGAAQEQGMLMLLLTGGEPLLRTDFQQIYEACIHMGIVMSINTNGTLLTENMISFLAKNPPSRVNVTMYGASAETYQLLCGNQAAYDKAVQGILGLKEVGIPVKLNCSQTPWNKQELFQMYQFAKEHDIPLQTASYMFPPVRACEHGCYQITRLTPEESALEKIKADEFFCTDEAFKQRIESLLKGVSYPEDDECMDQPHMEKESRQVREAGEIIPCRAGSTTFWITADGEMRPCGMMMEPSIDIKEFGFQQAWDYIHKERDKILMPAKCTACSIRHACEVCAAICYAETGSYEGVPSYMCKRTEAMLSYARDWKYKTGR